MSLADTLREIADRAERLGLDVDEISCGDEWETDALGAIWMFVEEAGRNTHPLPPVFYNCPYPQNAFQVARDAEISDMIAEMAHRLAMDLYR